MSNIPGISRSVERRMGETFDHLLFAGPDSFPSTLRPIVTRRSTRPQAILLALLVNVSSLSCQGRPKRPSNISSVLIDDSVVFLNIHLLKNEKNRHRTRDCKQVNTKRKCATFTSSLSTSISGNKIVASKLDYR